jgi:hypothetical protein
VAELIQNSSASTLNGTINNVVTSLTVTNGAVFPATGNFRILVCDPVTFANSELMLCTARASNVLTVTRGIETTTAVGHTTGALVTHVATVAGLAQYISEHSISQTIADAKGDIISATAADTLVRKAVGADKTLLMADSSQSDGLIWGGAWTTYVPVWTSTGTAPALGNGSLTGRYVQIGKTVIAKANLTMGSTTTFGTGNYFISLPATAFAVEVNSLGLARAFDASAGAIYGATAVMNTSSKVQMETFASSVVVWTNLVPVTWATSDQLAIQVIYEAA